MLFFVVFHLVLSDTDSDVLCSEECQTKKLLVCCIMFAFFKAIFKFCIAKKMFIFFWKSLSKVLERTCKSFKMISQNTAI